MSLEAAIMGFLAEGPRSGYDLKTRCFDEQASHFWTADQAQIYRTLDRLQSARMVTCSRQRQVSRPDRKVYRLTDAGLLALEQWLDTPAALSPPRDPFQLQVFFSAMLTDGEVVDNLTSQRGEHQERLEALRGEVMALAGQTDLPDRVRQLRGAAFDGAIARERAAIDWLDDTIEEVLGGHLSAGDGVDSGEDGQTESSSA